MTETVAATPEHRTMDDALKRFTLVKGNGDGRTSGCAMTLVSWVAGEPWSAYPKCAHRLLAPIVIKAFDAPGAVKTQQEQIVRACDKGVFDTWWVPTETVLAAIAQAHKVKSDPVDFCLVVLAVVASWKSASTKERANLRDANLGYADLRYADLRDANLGYANLRDANLRGANLRGADLRDADLGYADLRGANLRGANLRDANLRDAVGNSLTRLPDGWKVDDAGLIVRS